jgi:hypothetical protein
MYSPIKTINIAKLIKDGCDLNILCFDRQPTDDESYKEWRESFSKRLLFIMMKVADLNKIPYDTLFISSEAIPDISVIANSYNPKEIFGLKIHYVDGLDQWDDYIGGMWIDPKDRSKGRHIKYFESLGGSLAWGKKSLVMLGTEKRVLLGCY